MRDIAAFCVSSNPLIWRKMDKTKKVVRFGQRLAAPLFRARTDPLEIQGGNPAGLKGLGGFHTSVLLERRLLALTMRSPAPGDGFVSFLQGDSLRGGWRPLFLTPGRMPQGRQP